MDKSKNKKNILEIGTIITIVSLIISGIIFVTNNISQINTSIKYLEKDIASLETKTDQLLTVRNNSDKLSEVIKNVENLNSTLGQLNSLNINIDRISNKINNELIPALNSILVQSKDRKIKDLELAIKQGTIDSSLAIISSIESISASNQLKEIRNYSSNKSNYYSKFAFILFIISSLGIIILWIIRFLKNYNETKEINYNVLKSEIIRIQSDSDQRENITYKGFDKKLSEYHYEIEREIETLIHNKYQSLEKRFQELEQGFKIDIEKKLHNQLSNYLNTSNKNTYELLDYLFKSNYTIHNHLFKDISLTEKQNHEIMSQLSQQIHVIDLFSSDNARVRNAIVYLGEMGDKSILPVLDSFLSKYENDNSIKNIILVTKNLILKKEEK